MQKLVTEASFRSGRSQAVVKRAIKETSKRTRLSEKDVASILTKEYSEKNYFGVYPGVWLKDLSEADSSVLVDSYIRDTKKFGRLRHRGDKRGLKVVCYNVHYWFGPKEKLGLDAIVKVIGALEADVLCLQEVVMPTKGDRVESSDGWSRDDFYSVFEQMGYKYRSVCKADTVHSSGSSVFGNVIFSKMPFDKSMALTLAGYKQGRCLALAVIRDLVIASVHLDVFDDTGKTRRKEIRNALDFIENNFPDKPVILCGDFNSLRKDDYSSSEIEWLRRNSPSKLDFETIQEVEREGFTDSFNGIKFSAWSARRVDFMFTKNLRVESSSVMYSSASDHIPLVIEVRREWGATEVKPRAKKPVKGKSLYDKYVSMIVEKEDTRGVFNNLLFTHNTNLNVAFKMFSGEFNSIRCCDSTGRIIGRGAQFRWGLDSQYGDAKLIMKEDFWRKYSKGAIDKNGIRKVDYVVFTDIWREIQTNYEEVKDSLKEEARAYTFRERKRSNDMPCEKKDFSWCNFQIHIAENVSLDDIDKVILPRYLLKSKSLTESGESIPHFLHDVNTEDIVHGKPNPFKGKLLFVGDDDPNDYYAWVSQSLDYDRYLGPSSTVPRTAAEENVAIEQGTQRPRIYTGNSSQIANKIEVFRDEQAEYMLTLLNHGFYDH